MAALLLVPFVRCYTSPASSHNPNASCQRNGPQVDGHYLNDLDMHRIRRRLEASGGQMARKYRKAPLILAHMFLFGVLRYGLCGIRLMRWRRSQVRQGQRPRGGQH